MLGLAVFQMQALHSVWVDERGQAFVVGGICYIERGRAGRSAPHAPRRRGAAVLLTSAQAKDSFAEVRLCTTLHCGG